jgi:hypothetical protein
VAGLLILPIRKAGAATWVKYTMAIVGWILGAALGGYLGIEGLGGNARDGITWYGGNLNGLCVGFFVLLGLGLGILYLGGSKPDSTRPAPPDETRS